ncbi:HTH_48 domain-containing protein [Trichonephila clavipes]|nr:HTH_48 domain-containing protein [Trichonephila clavipes]
MTHPRVPNVGCHSRILPRTAQDHLCTHARLCFVSVGLVVKRFTMSFYQRSLRTCIRSNWNVYSRHCIRINQHWLIERVCCYCMIMRDRMSRGGQGIRYSDLVGRLCVILLTHLTLHHQIMTSSIPWTIIFGVNPSPMKQTCTKLSRTSLPPRFLPQGDLTTGDTLAEGAGGQW